MIAYKVVTNFKREKVRKSFLGKHPYSITYKIKSRNYPDKDCGPLCCFKSFDEVKKSFGTLSGLPGSVQEIWKVNIKKSRHKTVWHRSYSNHKISTSCLPCGTVLADWVEFIEKIG